MTFEKALEAMRQGKKLYRKAWRGTEMQSIFVSKDSLFSIICDDIFADDWEIYEESLKEPEMTAEKASRIIFAILGYMSINDYKIITECANITTDEIRDALWIAKKAVDNLAETEKFDRIKQPEKKCQCDCKCKDKDLQDEMKQYLSRKFFELGSVEKDSLAVSNMIEIYRLLFEVE